MKASARRNGYGPVELENERVGVIDAETPEAREDEHGMAALKKKRKRGGKVDGEAPRHRMDRLRRAHGGKVAKKGTTVNVIIAPQGAGGMGGPPPPPPMAPPPPPPMAPPPPPGGMMRKAGGRVHRAFGGQMGPGAFAAPHPGAFGGGPNVAPGGAFAARPGGFGAAPAAQAPMAPRPQPAPMGGGFASQPAPAPRYASQPAPMGGGMAPQPAPAAPAGGNYVSGSTGSGAPIASVGPVPMGGVGMNPTYDPHPSQYASQGQGLKSGGRVRRRDDGGSVDDDYAPSQNNQALQPRDPNGEFNKPYDQNEAARKSGGRVMGSGHKYPKMDAGALSGEGRLEKVARYGRRAKEGEGK